jgi:hypothetical protein
VIVPIALQIIIQTPIAIAQSLMQHSLGLQIFGEHSLDPQILGTSIIPIADMRFLRAYGLSDHPNILGGCIAFALVLLLVVVIYSKQRTAIIFCAMIFLLTFSALLLTFSRSAWLSLFVAGSFMLVSEASARRWESWKRIGILSAMCVIVIFPLLLNYSDVFQKRVATNITNDVPMQERTYLLQSGNTLFVEHSAIGIGLGATPVAMKRRFEFFPGDYQPPHYIPLLAALETGILGGFFYLILLWLPVIIFISKRKEYIHKPLILATTALLISISVVSFFDYYPWFYQAGRLWQWSAWALYSIALEKVK